MVRTFVLALFLSTAPVAFADDAGGVALVGDAGTPMSVTELTKRDQLAVDTDAGIVSPLPADDAAMVRAVYTAIKSGNGWLAGTAILLLVVGLLRKYGKKFGTGPWFYVNKPFWFLFETKVGGWILNWITAVAGGMGTAWAAGSKIDGALAKSVVMVSTSGTMLFELWKDVQEWWEARKAKAAGTAAAPGAPELPKPPAPTAPGA
jgi:hypothetical protein